MRNCLGFIILFFSLNVKAQLSNFIEDSTRSESGTVYLKFYPNNNIKASDLFTVYKSYFGLTTDDDMIFHSQKTDQLGKVHHRFIQFYKNIRIEFAEFRVHEKNGSIESANGRIINNLNFNLASVISATQAESILLSSFPNAAINKPATLLIMSKNLGIIATDFSIAYQFDISYGSNGTSEHLLVYINAVNGLIVTSGETRRALCSGIFPVQVETKHNGIQTVNACLDGTNYKLFDFNRNIKTYDLSGLQCTNLSDCSALASEVILEDLQNMDGVYDGNLEAHSVHWGVEATYDYFLNTHNHQSYDNNGSVIISFVNEGGSLNAAWDYIDNFMFFSTGPYSGPLCGGIVSLTQPLVCLDVIAHEFTHGMNNSLGIFPIIDPPSWSVTNKIQESAAIDESSADIFGTTVEFSNNPTTADWLIAKDCTPGLTDGLRSLSNPKTSGDCADGIDTYADNLLINRETHSMGLLQSYWFYLLSVGGAGTNAVGYNYSVSPIGMDKAAAIVYRALTINLSPLPLFIDMRFATLQSAIELYGQCSEETVQVMNAWDAVGVYDLTGVPHPASVLMAQTSQTNVTCNGSCNGSASITGVGGTPPYTYSWLTGATTSTINGLCALTTYTGTVKDANNCLATATATITQPPALTATSAQTNNTPCDGGTCNGSASITASGGTPPYTYSWNTGVTASTINNLCAGTYTIEIKDANSCVNTSTINITQLTFDVSSNLSSNTLTITSGTTVWDAAFWQGKSKILVSANIFIEPGATLKIKGISSQQFTVEFAAKCSIRVAQGGKLFLDYTTLTGLSGCQTMWVGIRIDGFLYPPPAQPKNVDPLSSSFSEGFVYLNNFSVIEHARIAVLSAHFKPHTIANFRAGAIWAKNSSFKNNRRGVYIEQTSFYDNQSSFKGCTFEITKTPLEAPFSGYKKDFFIMLVYVKGTASDGEGIPIKSCVFRNSFSFIPDERGTAIIGANSSYVAAPSSVGGDGCHFEGLTKGIDEYSWSQNSFIKIDHNTFNNVQQSITINGTSFYDISRNTFNIPASDLLTPNTNSIPTWGIYSYGGEGVSIIENSFISTAKGVFKGPSSHGLIVRESYSFGGEVYKNNFTEIQSVATQTEQDNSNLTIKCNVYTNNPQDWRITSGTLGNQGECKDAKSPAGNEFSPDCIGQGHIKSVWNFDYSHHKSPPVVIPTCINSKVNPLQCIAKKKPGSCPSRFGNVIGPDDPNNVEDKQLHQNNLIINFLQINNITAMVKLLEQINTTEAKKILIPVYINKEEYNNAQARLNEIPFDTDENVQYHSLYDLILNIYVSGRRLKNIDAAEESVIRGVASSQTKVSVDAQTVLHEVFEERMERIPEVFPEFIHGTLLCTNIAVSNDTLVIINTSNAVVPGITPAITDSLGNFAFIGAELTLLDSASPFSFDVVGPAGIINPLFKTIKEWISLSPLALNVQSPVVFTKITTGNVVTDIGASIIATWVDYDKDGFIDLYIGNGDGQNNAFYRNNRDGTYTKITTGPVVNDAGSTWGVTWGDYDNDGDEDLFISNEANQNNILYKNTGNGNFQQINTGNIVNDGGDSQGTSWGDYDNDGFLDLYVSNQHQANFLYRNNQNGTFTKITQGDIVTDVFNSVGCVWGDYNEDGYIDLFVANWTGQKNNLYKNNGNGTFTRITGGDIVNDFNIVNDIGDSRSASWVDYDNDGDLDMYVTNCCQLNNFFYENNGNGTFTKITHLPIVQDAAWTWGGIWGDYDNDGDVDLYLSNKGMNNHLYINNGDKSFTKAITGAIVSGVANSRGAAWGDHDKDGDLDLFVANENQPNFLYANEGSCNNWLAIRCIGTASNASGIGAKVRVKANIFSKTVKQYKFASGQNGAVSQDPLNVHFGMGNALVADTITVQWSSGITQHLTNVNVNQYLTIIEGQTSAKTDNSSKLNTEEENDDQQIPQEFKIFPNPFKNTTLITYTLMNESNVTIEAYNLLGKKVFTMINGTQDIGCYKYDFNPAEIGLSPGIYLLKYSANEKSETHKLMMLRQE